LIDCGENEGKLAVAKYHPLHCCALVTETTGELTSEKVIV